MVSVYSNELRFKYEAFGLIIHSSMELPELIPSDSDSEC